MKNFKRLLTVVLSVAVLLTAFAVIALAADGDAAESVTVRTLDFETYEDKHVFSDVKPKDGRWVIAAADNGNKYLVAEWTDDEGTTTIDNWDISTGFNADPTLYGVMNNPAMSIDLDIKSSSGYFNSVSIRPDLYGGVAASYRISQGKSCSMNNIPELAGSTEWNHLTLVYRHMGNGLFVANYYVNGVLSTRTDSIDYGGTNKFGATDSRNTAAGITNWDSLFDENGDIKYTNVNIMICSFYGSAAGRDISYDNVKFSVHPEGIDNDAIASFIYNDDYKMPYGETEAKVGEVVYDDAGEALLNAVDGDAITLYTDVGDIILNKAVTIDANKYADGVATGEFYDITVRSDGGYIVSYADGVYTLTKSDKNVTVVFDPDCGQDACDCYGEGVGHDQTYSIIVPVGVVPEFIPTIKSSSTDGVVTEFLGWSYEKGGEAVDLTAVTEAQADAGVLNIYPVYKITRYNARLVDGNRNVTMFFEHQFAEMLTAALASPGSVITLYSDVEYYKTLAFTSNSNITIDLNGYTLTRVDLYGAVKNYDAATQTYVDGTEKASAKFAFSASSVKGVKFTLTSSVDGGAFRSISVNGTAWYDENGKLERYEASSVAGGGFINNYCSGGTFNFTNMELYALNIQYGSHNGSPAQNLNFTNFKYYRTAGSEAKGAWGHDGLYLAGTVNLTAKDSLFYMPPSSTLTGDVRFLRMQGGQKCNLVFENCDIISQNASVGLLLESTNHKLSYTNCRLYNFLHESATYLGTFNENVVATNTNNLILRVNIAENCVMINKAQTFTYSLPANSRVTIDPTTKQLVFDFEFASTDLSFAKLIVDPSKYYAKVTWLDENGEVIAQTDAVKNEIAAPPAMKIPVGDQYRAFTNPDWLDENGNVSNLLIGDLDKYTFTLSTALPENPTYVPCITDVRLNMAYYGHFAYNLYVPVVEGVTINSIGGYDKLSKVLIDGKEFYTQNGGWPTPNTLLRKQTGKVIYTVEGVTYTASFSYNVVDYMDLLFTDPNLSEVEKDAAIKLMAYAEEIYKFQDADHVLEDSVQASFDDFFNSYNGGNRPEYITEYNENELHTVNPDLANYVDSLGFAIYSNNRMSFLITLSKESLDAGYTVSLTGSSGLNTPKNGDGTIKYNEDGSITYYTNNTHISGIINSNYTITIKNNGGKTVLTSNYSYATYANALDNNVEGIEVVDSFYTFAKAAAAARSYLATV